MMNKRPYLLLFILPFILYGFKVKNEDQEAISKILDRYINNIKTGAYEEAARHIYPTYYNFSSKTSLISNWETAYTDSNKHITIKDFEIYRISKIKEINTYKYALIQYGLKMETVIKNEENDPNFHFNLQQYFIKKFGKKNVQFFAEKETYEIITPASLLCIKSPQMLDWKFTFNNKSQEKFLQEYVPKKIIRKFLER